MFEDKKSLKNHLEFIFYHEEKIRRAVIEARTLKGYCDNSSTGYVQSGKISKPVESAVLFNLMPLSDVEFKEGSRTICVRRPEFWLEITSITWRSVPAKMSTIARLKYVDRKTLYQIAKEKDLKYDDVQKSAYRFLEFAIRIFNNFVPKNVVR